MLREEFLEPLGISQVAFAKRLGVSFQRLHASIRGRRAVTPDTALRLAWVTGTSAGFWLGLQQDWELWHALRTDEAASIARLTPLAIATERYRARRDRRSVGVMVRPCESPAAGPAAVTTPAPSAGSPARPAPRASAGAAPRG
ncbi:MAG: HigA family addiction module antitoxin [Trueperaceae bacterium]